MPETYANNITEDSEEIIGSLLFDHSFDKTQEQFLGVVLKTHKEIVRKMSGFFGIAHFLVLTPRGSLEEYELYFSPNKKKQ